MGGGKVAYDTPTGLEDSLVLDQSSLTNDVTTEFGREHERTLVLVGKTGNGKSATGNSILGETKFLSKRSGRSITKECELYSSKLSPNGQKINVIDTPGLFSASSTTEFTSREIVKCLRLAKDGIDAVLLVFSSRSRLTEEEESTLGILKILFGSKIVDYMIVVFTNGDTFENEETLDDYLEYCPAFQEILKECSDRRVLFDNRSDIPKSKKEKQVEDLLNLVEEISKKNNGQSYMADVSLELRENEATYEEKKKQIEAKKGLCSKQETSQLLELEKSYEEMLKGMEEKVFNQLKESLSEMKEQLSKAEARREEAERKMNDIQKLSTDEIKKLREQLDQSVDETKELRDKLDKKCTIL